MSLNSNSLCLSTHVQPNAGRIEDVRRALNSFADEQELPAASFPVTKVEVLKARRNLRHESVRATICMEDQTEQYWFFERAEKDKCPGTGSAGLWTVVAAPADNVMRISNDPGTSDYDIAAIIRFDPQTNRVTLLELARLAAAIHKFKPSYNLALGNCYWFAGVFVQFLLKAHGQVQEFSPVREITETTQAGYTRRFGYFILLHTQRPTDNELEHIREIYENNDS